MAVIYINGQRIDVRPASLNNVVHVGGGSITVNGVEVMGGLSGIVEVRWEGPLARLTCAQGSATVAGDVAGDVDAGGSVSVGGSVRGNVCSGGSASCGDVGGSVDAGGSINCGRVSGDADAGGSITMRK
jgi:hypothetical protein